MQENQIKQEVEPESKKRILSIDVIRGIAIFAMIIVNTISKYQNIPDSLKHAPDYGLTVVDLIAPLFIFTIALTYKMSFENYVAKRGKIQAYIRFVRRYTALIGLGIFGSLIIVSQEGIKFSWGILQSIGLAGIITLLFIVFPRIIRFIVALILLVGYQFLLEIQIMIENSPITIGDLNLASEHGGLMGAIGWGAMLLLGTAVIDNFHKKKVNQICIIGLILVALGTGVHFLWKLVGFPLQGGLSMHRVTPSYILLSVGLSAIFYWFLYYLYDKFNITKGKSYIFQPLGRNAIFLFILLGGFILLTWLYLPKTAVCWLVIFCSLINSIAIWSIAFLMNKKGIYIVL